MQDKPDVSVIIPTLNAEREIESLILALEGQSLPPKEIIIVDSSSADRTLEIAGKHAIVRTETVSTFNHGGTRDLAARMAAGDILIFMTQDALPKDKNLIKMLVNALREHPRAAAAYGRQIPRENAWPQEKLVRSFNYPEASAVHSLSSIKELGLRTFYLSNVCAAYRRDLYLDLGGFEQDLRSNEDMLFAAKAIRKGYEILYCAEAGVIHSHNLGLGEQYRRNRLQGYELARHRDLLENDSPVGSGKAMLSFVTKGLLSKGRITSWVRFCLDCCARYLGNRAGKREYERTRHGNIG